MPPELRLLIYDRTCRGRPFLPGLSHSWELGSALFSLLGRFDAQRGVASWAEALDWLATVAPGRRIAEVQYWGHGKWGAPRIDGESMREDALLPGHALEPYLDRVAARMLPGADGLWWFRTCDVFGAELGQRFAPRFANRMGCRTAGHTHYIWFFQSGLHSLLPGETPTWSDTEGLAEGTATAPVKSTWSWPHRVHTISALTSHLPQTW